MCVALGMLVTGHVCGAQETGAPAQAAQPEEGEPFDVWEIRVLGNTVLPGREIEATVYPFLGPSRSMAAIEQARLALEKKYKDMGYGTVFVDIPEQQVDDGVVRLRVTEGRLDRIRVSGARYYSNREIRQNVPALRKGEVVRLPELQEQLETVNRQARDRSVVPVLRAGREPGQVDVDLKVTDKLPMHGSAEVNDKYTADTSHTRANATWSFDNLWQRYHSLSLQYQTAPEEPDEARVLAATYVAPLQSTGHMLAAFIVDTDSEFTTLGAEFDEFGVIGKGRIYGARYIIPLPETSSYFHNMTFGADYKDFNEVISQQDGTLATTPISYINWSLSYAGTVRTERTLSSFDIGANLGIRGLGNSSEEFYFKRYAGVPNKGEPSYFSLHASARHERPLFANVSAFGQLAGQYSPQSLISNEQFAVGGVDSVRGYHESESLGDIGASGNLELRLALPQSWIGASPRLLQLFTFVDAGVVAIQHPLPEQDTRASLMSWGAGLNISGFGGLYSSLAWANPQRSTDKVASGDSRIHFQLRYGF